MPTKNLKEYNSNYYIRNKKRIQKERKIRYRTDVAYREDLKRRVRENNLKKNKFIKLIKEKFGVTSMEEIERYGKKVKIKKK